MLGHRDAVQIRYHVITECEIKLYFGTKITTVDKNNMVL